MIPDHQPIRIHQPKIHFPKIKLVNEQKEHDSKQQNWIQSIIVEVYTINDFNCHFPTKSGKQLLNRVVLKTRINLPNRPHQVFGISLINTIVTSKSHRVITSTFQLQHRTEIFFRQTLRTKNRENRCRIGRRHNRPKIMIHQSQCYRMMPNCHSKYPINKQTRNECSEQNTHRSKTNSL